jgi:hypothetical protein
LNVKRKDKLPFLKELLKRMEFVEVVEPSKAKAICKKEILAGIEASVRFVKKYEKGKVKAKPFQQLLNEL